MSTNQPAKKDAILGKIVFVVKKATAPVIRDILK